VKIQMLSAALVSAGFLSIGAVTPLHAGAPATEQAPTQAAPAAPTQAAPAATRPAPVATPATRALPDFETIVAQQGPAVVNIRVIGAVREAAAEGRLQPFDPFGRGLPPGRGMPDLPPPRGMGSGFILTADGLILTNAHVVENAREVTVRLTDRREFRAEVLGADSLTDVAVLRIDAKDLPHVTLGDVDALNVAEWVLAIGSPFGLENSATVGVVSAKKRALPGAVYVPFIQTDVAVNPGNSGGPLFNSRGEVIGINSMIYSRTGGFQGLSFAIPIDVAMQITDQILKTGQVQHGRLGVGIQEMNQELARSFGLERPEGAIITTVEPDGPAARAGLQTGDVIRSVNKEPVAYASDLPAVVAMLPPGEEVLLDVWRKGQATQITATLGSRGGAPVRVKDEDKTDAHPKLGLTVRPVQVGEVPKDAAGGLLVQSVTGAAANAGVRPGDVLLRVNGTDVGSVEDIRKAMEGAGETVALLIQRGEGRMFVPVRIG
jgi:serine protease Do